VSCVHRGPVACCPAQSLCTLTPPLLLSRCWGWVCALSASSGVPGTRCEIRGTVLGVRLSAPGALEDDAASPTASYNLSGCRTESGTGHSSNSPTSIIDMGVLCWGFVVGCVPWGRPCLLPPRVELLRAFSSQPRPLHALSAPFLHVGMGLGKGDVHSSPPLKTLSEVHQLWAWGRTHRAPAHGRVPSPAPLQLACTVGKAWVRVRSGLGAR
jgi:hypothetical protein